MDTQPHTFANRREPIPVLNIDSSKGEKTGKAGDGHGGRTSVQDRLLTAVLQQVLPVPGQADDATHGKHEGVSVTIEKPNFSLPTMSNNFKRFNARIGIVFVFQDKVTRLLSWNVPVHTWSFLAVYTFCCLNPNLLVAFPLAALLSFVMVPAFLTRHPSPPDSLSVDTYPLEGPASAPAPTIKPAPEMSKDFFRNMRDLQNCMEDFSVVHDAVIDLVAPPTNFSDEKLSTAIFLVTFLSACVLLLTANSIPWRFAFLAGGWAAILSAHPEVSSFIMSLDFSSLSKHRERLQRASREWINEDVILDEVPETRQVEVFELQHRNTAGQWELWVYGPSPYHPLSPIRLAGERPKGTRFFEDVQPPKGWEWSEKKWALDPLSKEWVDERMITVVEVETDGERWVYDLSAGDVDVETRSADTAVGAPQVQYEDTSASQKLKGEWRRRRWIRLVRRKVVKSKSRIVK